jgi:hypothetical protein
MKLSITIAIIIATLTTALLWLVIERKNYFEELNKQQGVVEYLKSNQRIVSFSMDESCYTQFQNSPDGIIRIQLGKK